MHDADEDTDTITYKVLVNDEEQYSLWAADDDIPHGWRDVGQTGPKSVCLAYIERMWTDMRPKSLRKMMEDASQTQQPVSDIPVSDESSDDDSNNTSGDQDLVSFLCRGEHPVIAGVGSGTDAEAFKDSIDKGFVYITFTRTAGGTELGVELDSNASDISHADFEAGTGNVHLVGDLTLNWQKVCCIADIDIATLKGRGYLKTTTD